MYMHILIPKSLYPSGLEEEKRERKERKERKETKPVHCLHHISNLLKSLALLIHEPPLAIIVRIDHIRRVFQLFNIILHPDLHVISNIDGPQLRRGIPGVLAEAPHIFGFGVAQRGATYPRARARALTRSGVLSADDDSGEIAGKSRPTLGDVVVHGLQREDGGGEEGETVLGGGPDLGLVVQGVPGRERGIAVKFDVDSQFHNGGDSGSVREMTSQSVCTYVQREREEDLQQTNTEQRHDAPLERPTELHIPQNRNRDNDVQHIKNDIGSFLGVVG